VPKSLPCLGISIPKYLALSSVGVSGSSALITENEKFILLKFAVIFLNYGEKELEKFG
jgi:intracellular septation protein A